MLNGKARKFQSRGERSCCCTTKKRNVLDAYLKNNFEPGQQHRLILVSEKGNCDIKRKFIIKVRAKIAAYTVVIKKSQWKFLCLSGIW